MNFVHNFPHSCISIALYVNKITQIGIVYNPVMKQKFTARLGQGAFYNGKQTFCSGQTDLGKSLITTEFGTSLDEEKILVVCENISKIVRKVHG
jgi:myo-inositol-1(or 4)-monophosphatase